MIYTCSTCKRKVAYPEQCCPCPEKEQPKFEIAHCETGCMVFHGGEKKHIKECDFYSDSLSQAYDALETKAKLLQKDLVAIESKYEQLSLIRNALTSECDALQSQLTAANAKVERLESVLKKLSDEMQVFLNVSQKIHFPDAREAQAQALGILTKVQEPQTEEK